MDEERNAERSSENAPLLRTQATQNGSDRNEIDTSLGSPDGCRAWIVASSIFVVNFIIIGLGRVSGIFYVDFMRVFGINRQMASTPFSAQQSTRNLFGPVVGILGRTFSNRALTMTGGLIGALSAAGCAFVTNIIWISILWGVLYGIATAFTSTINQTLINDYFVKHRSTASGVCFAGGSLGAMIFPFLVDYLMNNLGYTATFLCMAALLLLIVPIAIIMKRPPWIRDEEPASEVATDEPNRPQGERTSGDESRKFFGGNLCVTSVPQSDETSKVEQKSRSGETSREARHKREELLRSQVSTGLKSGSKFIKGNNKDIGVFNESMPLNAKSDFGLKPKPKLGVIFHPIVALLKEMLVEPSNGNMKDISSVSKKINRLGDTVIEVVENPDLLSRVSYQRQENFNSKDVINNKGKSNKLLKRSISAKNMKVKESIRPGKDDINTNISKEGVRDSYRPNGQYFRSEIVHSTQNTGNQPFSASDLLISSSPDTRTEGLLKEDEKRNTDVALASEKSAAIQPEMYETSLATSHNLISHKSPLKFNSTHVEALTSSGTTDLDPEENPDEQKRVQPERFSKEKEHSENLIAGAENALYSENIVENIKSKSGVTEMCSAGLQSGAVTGPQITILSKQQGIEGKKFQVSIIPDVSAETNISHSVIPPLNTQALSLEDLDEKDDQTTQSTDQFQSQTNIKQENVFANDLAVTKILSPVTSTVETESITLTHSITRPNDCNDTMADRFVDDPSSKQSLIQNKIQEEISTTPGSHTVVSFPEESAVSGDKQIEFSKNDFSLHGMRYKSKNVKNVSRAKKKVKTRSKSQSYKTTDSNGRVPTILQREEVQRTVTGSKTDIKSEEIKLSNENVDFKALLENINCIIRIIRITESLKQLSYSPGTQPQFSDISEIRNDLRFLIHSMAEILGENGFHLPNSKMNIHSSSFPEGKSTFREQNGMFRNTRANTGNGSNLTGSYKNEFENGIETYSIRFRNKYIYDVLLTVFYEDENVIASHFPEQDQGHILKVILDLKKLVSCCQMLESKYSNPSAISKKAMVGLNPEQGSDSKTFTQKGEAQQSVDSIGSKDAGYGSFEQKIDNSRFPPSSRYQIEETSFSNSQEKFPLENSRGNPNQNENDEPNILTEQIEIAFKLYANPLFILVCIGRVIHFFTFMTVITIIVDFGIDRGLQEKDGKLLIGAMSLGDFIGRLCCGWLTDFGLISLEWFMVICMTLLGTLSISLYLVPLKHLYLATGLFSLLQGAVFVRHPVLVCKYTRHYEHSIALGFINLWAGVLGFVAPTYIGYFRDVLGSYDQMFFINGLMCIAVGLMWTFVPCILKLCSYRLGYSD